MKPLVTRPYRSGLRQEQAGETRARILDATLRVMKGGLASLSIPAVAREAGVSVPTVYRHFGTKRDLLAAIYPHAARQGGFDTIPDPRSVDELATMIRAYLERLDALDDAARAAMAGPIADEVRHATISTRYERLRGVAASIEPRLRAADQDRITRLLAILTTSASLRMWRDHLGLSVDEVAEEIEWIVRAAISASTSRPKR